MELWDENRVSGSRQKLCEEEGEVWYQLKCCHQCPLESGNPDGHCALRKVEKRVVVVLKGTILEASEQSCG